MADQNSPVTSSQPVTRNHSSMLWIAAGTMAAILVAGGLMQVLKPQPGAAATEPAAGSAKPQRRVEAMARVGKDVISFDMVAEECVARNGREVLDDLINRMIIQQACETRGISVSEEEVSAEIQRMAVRFKMDPQDWYKMLQAERSITPQQYRQSVIWPMLALKKLASEKVNVSEEEVVEAFQRNYGPRVKVRMIVMDNERRAREVWDKARQNPEDFERLAQEFSIDPGSRALGGAVPPIPKHSGNPDLEKAAFKLKMNEVSGIVQVGTGRYAILKCEGRTEQVITDMADVQDSLVDELVEAKTQQSVAKIFEQLKKEARVDNYLTGVATGGDRFTSGTNPAAPGNAITPASATGTGSARVRQATAQGTKSESRK